MKIVVSHSLFWALASIGIVLIVPSCLNQIKTASKANLGGSETMLDPVEYKPVNVHLLASSIDVRATYLLSKFRETENALIEAENYQLQLTQRVTETQNRLGIFDGEASAFSELSNQYSELLAVETVIHWLTYPQTAKTKVSIPLNEPIEITVKDDAY